MKRLLGTVLLLGTPAAAIASGCGGGTSPAPEVATVATTKNVVAATCERTQPGVGPKRYGEHRQGASVALAHLGVSVVAYVADEDTHAIHTVDIGKKEQLGRIKLGGAPAQVLVLADGRVVATLRDKSEVVVLEPTETGELRSLCRRSVPTEPIGLAATPDDKSILVTSGWGASLTSLDATTLTSSFAVDLAREPRAVLVDESGQRAFVSHAVGARLSVVELMKPAHEVREIDLGMKRASPTANAVTEKPRGGSQGFMLTSFVPSKAAEAEKPPVKGTMPKPRAVVPKGRIFVPMVTVEPGDPNVRSQAYYGDSRDGVPKEAPVVNVIDSEAERSMTTAVMSLGTTKAQECLLPRGAATRESTGTLFVTCLGIDALLELDTRGADPIRLERRRWNLPQGPTGVAVDDREQRAVVWSQFEGKLSVVDLTEGKRGELAKIDVAYAPEPQAAALARGRALFHTTDDLRISNDGVACASCHPDGRDDAFTWSTPEGPRQTIMLAGRATDTAPYGWQGKHGDLKSYLGSTFRRLGGSGVTGQELEALVTYLEKIPGPSPVAMTSTVAASDVEHGKKLFFDASLGCATCHFGGDGVDKTTHDVGSKSTADVDVKFDTPSLRFVSGTAPYFHDGRYSTLEKVLAANDTQMGHTLQLNSRERSALAAYLESL